MFEYLLDYICEKSVYTEVKGMTPTGAEKILRKDSGSNPDVYKMGDSVVFVQDMVGSILFHKNGCTITLKN